MKHKPIYLYLCAMYTIFVYSAYYLCVRCLPSMRTLYIPIHCFASDLVGFQQKPDISSKELGYTTLFCRILLSLFICVEHIYNLLYPLDTNQRYYIISACILSTQKATADKLMYRNYLIFTLSTVFCTQIWPTYRCKRVLCIKTL